MIAIGVQRVDDLLVVDVLRLEELLIDAVVGLLQEVTHARLADQVVEVGPVGPEVLAGVGVDEYAGCWGSRRASPLLR